MVCELLTGVEISGKTQRRFGRKAIAQPPEDWIRRPIFQPIISEADFRHAAAMRARPGYHRHRTNAQMLDELRIVVAKHGRVSHSLINRTLGSDKASNFYKRFGSLSNACLLIDQPVKKNGLGRRIGAPISDDELLKALRDLEAQHGHVSTGLLTRDPNMPSPTTYHKRFGSMVAAYKAAGVTSIKTVRNWKQLSH